MASSRPYRPVLHCTAQEYILVNILAKRLINGLYATPLVFVTPPVASLLFTGAQTLLNNLIAEAKGNTAKRIARDAQSVIVFGYINELLLYVTPICHGDTVLIESSGFSSNYQPEKLPPPVTEVTSKVVKGTVAGTYKVFLTRRKIKMMINKLPKSHLKNVLYTVQLTTTVDDAASWKNVVEGVASTKLIFTDVVEGEKNWVRVYGVNSAGKGQPNDPFPFTPEVQ